MILCNNILNDFNPDLPPDLSIALSAFILMLSKAFPAEYMAAWVLSKRLLQQVGTFVAA
jgi:hypothetical protein